MAWATTLDWILTTLAATLTIRIPTRYLDTYESGQTSLLEIYFCEFIIRPYLKDPKHSKFIDEKVLDKYWDVGGVRIEDNLLITKDGSINLTDAIKDPDEIEKIISSS
ncbi:hypothetical protein PC116_g30023 [Phytophthora cactorum]|nr:hypothetical protein PC116_g30023 [Phytophthora cactorum]